MEKVLTNLATWKDIDLRFFEKTRDKFLTHIIHFITKGLTNTPPFMQVLPRRQHATSDLFP